MQKKGLGLEEGFEALDNGEGDEILLKFEADPQAI
jgi:hypothetical protein